MSPPRTPRATEGRSTARAALVVSVLITLLAHHTFLGDVIGWPLVLLSTVMHELGHGLTAILVGGSFEGMTIHTDASGLARTRTASEFHRALVAAGGLIGPPVMAALCFRAGQLGKGHRAILGAFGLGFLATVFLVDVNIFGLLVLGGFGLLLCGVGWAGSELAAQVMLMFLATQLALSTWSRSDYLFQQMVGTPQGPRPSDVGRIQEVLWLPYWFWGGLIGLMSASILWVGLRGFLPELDDTPG